MFKLIISACLAVFLTGSFFVSTSMTAEPTTPKVPMAVAVAPPGNANTPITGQNLPLYLDEDLASKHADFSRFAKSEVRTLNRNHRLSKSRMQIVKQDDGSYLARFHRIDSESLICKVRRSKSKTIPYVGVLRYKEKVFEATGASPEACRQGEFIPVAIIPNRHIFSFKKGSWQ